MRICPSCGEADPLPIFNSRPSDQPLVLIWRRRECTKCLARFDTYELPSSHIKKLVKMEITKALDKVKESLA